MRFRPSAPQAGEESASHAISFGLVTIPVNLYSAIKRRETLSFNLLHKKDNVRVRNKRFCSEENIDVPWQDVVKGYEYAEVQYVVMIGCAPRPPLNANVRLQFLSFAPLSGA